MKYPPEIIPIIQKISKKLAKKFKFGAYEHEDIEQEAESIVQLISNLKKSNLINNYSDITILFRSVLNESPLYINKLSQHNIPFKVIGVDKIETSLILFSVVDLWKFCSGYSDKLESNNTLIKMSQNEIDLFTQCDNSPELFLKKVNVSSKCKIEFAVIELFGLFVFEFFTPAVFLAKFLF